MPVAKLGRVLCAYSTQRSCLDHDKGLLAAMNSLSLSLLIVSAWPRCTLLLAGKLGGMNVPTGKSEGTNKLWDLITLSSVPQVTTPMT